jgi:hypothetical protein
MAVIEKKIWPKFFDAILRKEKTFEVRLADFEITKGDTLLLREYDPEKKEYTGREIKKEVTYLTKSKDWKFWSKKEVEKHGYQVIGFR